MTPTRLPIWEYFKQVFWSSGVDLNEESFESLSDEVVLDALELPAGEKRRCCRCNCRRNSSSCSSR